MRLRREVGIWLSVVAGCLWFSGATYAVITALTPLRAVVEKDSQFIFVARVEKLLPEKPALVALVEKDLKGVSPIKRLPMSFAMTADAKKEQHLPKLLARLPAETAMIVFLSKQGKRYFGFAFTNGTWINVTGRQGSDPAAIAWTINNAEPYLRRTFKGTTDELKKIIVDGVAGRGAFPEPNEKEPPGFGPEATQKSSSLLSPGLPGGFAVIPTLGIGAPLAILALLFPAVFGGVLVLFRQWLAFITVLSINGTLLLLHWWLAPKYLRSSWFGTDAGLWFVLTIVALACTLWAWRRQLDALWQGDVEAPAKTEQTVLLVMAGACLAVTFGLWWLQGNVWTDLNWAMTLVFSVGSVVGAGVRWARRYLRPPAPVAIEGVMLGAMTLTHFFYGGLRWGQSVDTTAAVEAGSSASSIAGMGRVEPPRKLWEFQAKNSGLFVSSPQVDGDRVYIASAYTTFKIADLFCFDRMTGEQRWSFSDDGDFKEAYSSPTIADGRVVFGEGFHDDGECKLYCVDAKTGEKVWDFKTASQTEGTPTISGGRVYFGAGNDGFACLDFQTGKKIWQFPEAAGTGRLLRFGAGGAVHDGRVYVGTGQDRNQPDDKGETAVFALDASSGKPIWKQPVPHPVWGKPVVVDDRLYVGVGNGDIFTDAPKPAGLVYCIGTNSGDVIWKTDLPNLVLASPAVDATRLYVGCRDGNVYALDRLTGAVAWKASMGSPVVTTPALANCPGYEATAHVYVAASGGKVCCLEPHKGGIVWTYDLSKQRAFLASSPRVVVNQRTGDGDRRQIYFGSALGGAQGGTPVFFCLEDLVRIE